MEQADLTGAALLDAPGSPLNPANVVMTDLLGARIFADLRDAKQWAYGAVGLVEGGRAGQMLSSQGRGKNDKGRIWFTIE